MDLKGTKATWYGHGTYSFETTEGKTVLVDPWVMNNPGCPDELKDPSRSTSSWSRTRTSTTSATRSSLHEAVSPRRSRSSRRRCGSAAKDVPNVTGMNLGGTAEAQGVRFTMVKAEHSCGISDGDQILYGGVAAGYVIEFPGGLRIYYAGDTTVFGDMEIIGDLYDPDVAFLPIGDFYTMSPKEAAYAVELLDVDVVVPMHYGTFPVLTGTPDELE